MICKNESICQEELKINNNVIIFKPNKQSALQQFSYQLKQNIDTFEEEFYQPDYRLEDTEDQDITSCNSKEYHSSSYSETEMQNTQPKIKKSIFYHKYNKNIVDDQTSFTEQQTQKSNLRPFKGQENGKVKYSKNITGGRKIIFKDETNSYMKNTLRNVQYVRVIVNNPSQYWKSINKSCYLNF